MLKSANSMEVRRQNRSRILKYIKENKVVSRQEIATGLGYSMPTVFSNITELMEYGLIREAGEYGSTGGRKAKTLVISPQFRYAVGIDITKHHVRMLLLDLCGEILATDYYQLAFADNLEYYRGIADLLESFLDQNKVSREKLVGVGISVPGIIIPDRNVLQRSHILEVSGVSLQQLSQCIPYPVVFDNDANCATYTEVDHMRNTVYIFLGNTVGGAVYHGGQLHSGDHFKAGEFGHMVIHPNGRRCYCGKIGCLDAYCSVHSLLETSNGKLEDFFRKVSANDETSTARWVQYLDDLAIGVSNLRMIFDTDIILGGYIGGYMDAYMDLFLQKVRMYNNFDIDETYIRTGKHKQLSSALGAAHIILNRYIDVLEL